MKTADSAVYLCIYTELYSVRSLVEKINNFDRNVYWRNNGYIVNVNII